MAKRLRVTQIGSFFGGLVYDWVIPKTHFLYQLNETVDWKRIVPT